MNKLKLFVLGITGAVFVTAGLYACSNDEANNPQQENPSIALSAKSSQEIGATPIGNIENGKAIPLYKEDLLKANLISKGFFAEIESIDLEYGYDSENKEDVAYFTIIGKNASDFSLEAFQAELIVDGNVLIMPDPRTPELPITTFAKHSCAGAPCNSCEFTRTGFLNLRITGCKCNEKKEGTRCNHGLNGGASTKELVDTVVDTVL